MSRAHITLALESLDRGDFEQFQEHINRALLAKVYAKLEEERQHLPEFDRDAAKAKAVKTLHKAVHKFKKAKKSKAARAASATAHAIAKSGTHSVIPDTLHSLLPHFF